MELKRYCFGTGRDYFDFTLVVATLIDGFKEGLAMSFLDLSTRCLFARFLLVNVNDDETSSGRLPKTDVKEIMKKSTAQTNPMNESRSNRLMRRET